jgi:hypothetical protein
VRLQVGLAPADQALWRLVRFCWKSGVDLGDLGSACSPVFSITKRTRIAPLSPEDSRKPL